MNSSVCMRKSGDKLQESVVFFHNGGPWDLTKGAMLSGRNLSLAEPRTKHFSVKMTFPLVPQLGLSDQSPKPKAQGDLEDCVMSGDEMTHLFPYLGLWRQLMTRQSPDSLHPGSLCSKSIRESILLGA